MGSRQVETPCEVSKLIDGARCTSNTVRYQVSKGGEDIAQLCDNCIPVTYDLKDVKHRFLEWTQN